VLLPTQRHAEPSDLLNPAILARLAKSTRTERLDIQLPRWDTSSNGSLKSLLTSVGLRRAFYAGAFGGIADDPTLQLGDVVQGAKITVTEEGTAGAIGGDSIPSGRPATARSFIVNHPFAFAIVHQPTGVPLFEGVVVDPS
jgi:serine protease inhibitor